MANKFCMYCGQALPSGIKFCPNCGKPVNSKEPANNTTNQKVAYDSDATNNDPVAAIAKSLPKMSGQSVKSIKSIKSIDYKAIWQWFVRSLRHPFEMSHTPKYAGLISAIIYYVLFVWSLHTILIQLMWNQLGVSIVESKASDLGLSDIVHKLAASSDLQSIAKAFAHAWWLLLYFGFPISVGLLYVGIHLFRAKTPWTLDILNEFMHRFNIAIPITLLIVLFQWLDHPKLGLAILFVTMIIGAIAAVATMKIYEYEYRIPFPMVAIISVIVIGIILLIIFALGFNAAQKAVNQGINVLNQRAANAASTINDDNIFGQS